MILKVLIFFSLHPSTLYCMSCGYGCNVHVDTTHTEKVPCSPFLKGYVGLFQERGRQVRTGVTRVPVEENRWVLAHSLPVARSDPFHAPLLTSPDFQMSSSPSSILP